MSFAQDGTVSIFSAQPLPDDLEPVTSLSLSSGSSRPLSSLYIPAACARDVTDALLSPRAEPLGATLFHPYLPLLLTASGTRKFGQGTTISRGLSEEDSGSDGEASEAGEGGQEGTASSTSAGGARASFELWQLS